MIKRNTPADFNTLLAMTEDTFDKPEGWSCKDFTIFNVKKTEKVLSTSHSHTVNPFLLLKWRMLAI